MDYKQKYLKYKLKYLTAKKMYGGSEPEKHVEEEGGIENESGEGSWTFLDLMMVPKQVGKRFVTLEKRVEKLENPEKRVEQVRSDFWGSGPLGMDTDRVAERFVVLEKRIEELEKRLELEQVWTEGWGSGQLGMHPSLVAQRFRYLEKRVKKLENPEEWESEGDLYDNDEEGGIENNVELGLEERVENLEGNVEFLMAHHRSATGEHYRGLAHHKSATGEHYRGLGATGEHYRGLDATGEHYRGLNFPAL